MTHEKPYMTSGPSITTRSITGDLRRVARRPVLVGMVMLIHACGASADRDVGTTSPTSAAPQDPGNDAAPSLLEASIDDRGLVLQRNGVRAPVAADHLGPDSRLQAVALAADGPEDAVIAHGPGGALIAGPGVAGAERLWAHATGSHDVNDMAIAGPWRHAHRLVDAGGDGRRELLTVATRRMDVGTERKLNALRWDVSAFAAVAADRAHAWDRATRAADREAVRRAIAQNVTGRADIALHLIA